MIGLHSEQYATIEALSSKSAQARDAIASELHAHLSHLQSDYPNFRDWFCSIVLPGLEDASREVFIYRQAATIQGVAIAKRDTEKKFSTLWVRPEVRTFRIATSLSEITFSWLGTRKPVFTVTEDRLSEFRPLISRWEFQECQRLADRYKLGSTEHVFNGVL